MKKAAVLAALICLLVVTIPLQYLVRREVVVGLSSESVHSHAHEDSSEEEQDHAQEHT